jgi:hypothetical protein
MPSVQSVNAGGGRKAFGWEPEESGGSPKSWVLLTFGYVPQDT